MAGRRLWVIAAVWLLTVAAASTVTWTVIASAGARVGNPVRLVTTTTSAVPTESQATWTGKAGRLTAACSDGSVALVSAVPEVGFWVKVYDRGPRTLRVDFESTDADDNPEVKVFATCRNGSPAFEHD